MDPQAALIAYRDANDAYNDANDAYSAANHEYSTSAWMVAIISLIGVTATLFAVHAVYEKYRAQAQFKETETKGLKNLDNETHETINLKVDNEEKKESRAIAFLER